MLTVYHLSNSRSDRIVWLVEELGVDYQLERFERDPETGRAPASLQALHPFARSPLVRDGDLLLSESGAIIETLAAKYGAGTLAGVTCDDSEPGRACFCSIIVEHPCSWNQKFGTPLGCKIASARAAGQQLAEL